jgi:hypothetical protein
MIYIYVTLGREFFFSMAHHPLAGQSPNYRGFMITLRHTHHTQYDSSVQVINPTQRTLLDNTQHSQQIYIHAPGGIRAHSPSKRAAADPRRNPRCHQVRPKRNMQPNIRVKSSRSHRLRNKPRAQVGSSVCSKTYTYIQRHCCNGIYIFLIQKSRVVRNVIDTVFVRIWLLEANVSCYCFGFPHKRFGMSLTVGILITNDACLHS